MAEANLNTKFISFELCATLNEAQAKALAQGNAQVIVTNMFNVFGGGQLLFERGNNNTLPQRLFLVQRTG